MAERIPVVIRIAPTGLAEIDRRAAAAGISRSEWIRRTLAAAITGPAVLEIPAHSGQPQYGVPREPGSTR